MANNLDCISLPYFGKFELTRGGGDIYDNNYNKNNNNNNNNNYQISRRLSQAEEGGSKCSRATTSSTTAGRRAKQISRSILRRPWPSSQGKYTFDICFYNVLMCRD